MYGIRNYYPRNRSANALLDIQVTETGVTDPVTLDDVKKHLRIDFDDDDAYISILLKSARLMVEKYTGLSLVPKTISLQVDNSKGNFELPYGPVVSITSVKDIDNVVIATADYTFTGTDFLKLEIPRACFVAIVYTAGYTEIPAGLALAIMAEVAFAYENRGDDATGKISPVAKSYAKPYRRITWLV